MSTERSLFDRIDDTAITVVFVFGSFTILMFIGVLLFGAFNADSEIRNNQITLACIESGGVWTDGTDKAPASCTRPTT